MIVILAINHKEASYYCNFVAEPRLDPNDQRKVVIFGTDSPPRGTKGRMLSENDTIVYYNSPYRGRYCTEIVRDILGPTIDPARRPKEVWENG